MNVDKWIEALQHPLVLAGFGLFLFAALIKPLFLNNEKLSGTAMERLLHKGMNFAFALALLAIAGGLLLSWKPNAAGGEINFILILAVLAAAVSLLLNWKSNSSAKDIVKSLTGNQSPVIEAKADVSISYGLDEAQLKAMLERQQEELFRKLRESGFAADDGERRLLEQQLQAVSAKLADIERSYEEELARRKAADAALAQLRGQLPEAQIENAQANLRQGDKDAAKSVFHGVLDKDGASVALAAYQLGQMAEGDLNYAEAMRMYKKAVVLEEDKPEYLLAAGKMARKLAEFKQAQDWLEHLREIREAEGESAEFGSALHELALLYKDQGKYKEAEPLYLRAVEIKEKALGRNHPDVAEALNDLAVLYRREGKYKEAEPLYLRALAVKEQAYGKDHLSVAQTLNDLALFYWSLNRFSES